MNLIVLNTIPTLLNKLYIPICRNNKPSIIKNKEAKEFVKLVYMEAIRQKANKKLSGGISIKIDIEISKRRNYDIDSVLKLLLDALNGVCYSDDKQIVDLQIRKHIKCDNDRLVILIENIKE